MSLYWRFLHGTNCETFQKYGFATKWQKRNDLISGFLWQSYINIGINLQKLKFIFEQNMQIWSA